MSVAPGLSDPSMVAGLPEEVACTIVENAYFNATTISLDAGARMSGR